MTNDYDTMPESYREAFRTAVIKLRDWIRYGGAEPESNLADRFYSISSIFDLMTKFDQDQMPEGILEMTLSVMGGVRSDAKDDIQRDTSYGNAAKHLVQRTAERKTELERREEVRNK